MARPERFELPTTKFVAWYSIQLSYGRVDQLLHDRLARCNELSIIPGCHESVNGELRTSEGLHGSSMGTTLAAPGPPGSKFVSGDLRNAGSATAFHPSKKQNAPFGAFWFSGGERGIRTLDQAFDPILP